MSSLLRPTTLRYRVLTCPKRNTVTPLKRKLTALGLCLLVLSIAAATLMQSSSALTNSGNITTLGSPLTENFNTLATAGTANVWTDNLTIGGMYAQFGAVVTNPTTYRAAAGAENTGAIYSFGTGTNTERAFGSIASGTTGDIFYGFKLTNGTASQIKSLNISYTGEQWRNGGNVNAQQLDFQYQVASPGTITDANTPATGWTDFNPLDFVSPVTGATAAALTGNDPANRIAKSAILPASVSPGQELWIRWKDINDAGNDHGLAIDDVSITATDQVVLSINDVTLEEGDSGSTLATFTVSLSSTDHSGVTFDIATQDNSATAADNDYVSKTLTSQTIPPGSATYSFEVTVNGDLTFEPDETFLVNVTNISGALAADTQGVGTIDNDDCPASPGDVVISQIYGGGGNNDAPFTHDFIELFNRGTTPVNLSGWSVQYQSATGTGIWQVTPLSGSIAPGGYYLIQEASNAAVGSPLPAPDASGSIAMAAGAGKVALSASTTAFSDCPSCAIDLVGYGTTASCFEGSGPTANLSNTTAALRKRNGCFDSNNNNIDFAVGAPNPRNTASPTNSCAVISLAIHDIQGSGATTPYANQFVSASGIVTGLKTNGFFMQELESNYDADSNTSEGIFVFTSSAPTVAVGDSVTVQGTATEFFNLTQVESTLPGDVSVTTTGNALPSAITLTTTILNPAGTPDQLEKFEGMRMHADNLVSVAPTNEFGETFTVLQGVARPIREPGIEFGLPVPPDPTSGVADCCIPIWDKNPERIMIDSDGLAGHSLISATSNVTFSNVTGPLDFTFGDYKIDLETTPTTSANMSAVPVPTPEAGEFAIAGFNIENFNNNATQRHKAALAIRDVLHLPDIIGTIEIFELSGLQALANEIESISGVHYEARLIEADGTSGDADQDVGFLIKTSRIQIDSVIQEELAGCDGTPANCNTFTDPNTGNPALLNDRPPLVLRATVDPAEANPVHIIVIVNHTRSFIDIEGLDAEGARVRAKRKAQGEFLANLLQNLQTNNPTTPIMSIGDYNAYQFNDGYTDPIATIRGTPTSDDQVVVDESPDLVNPDFINLTDELPADQRYSFIFGGTPQAIDHHIVNTVAHSMLQRYAVARNNSDFPEVPASTFVNDNTRPERCSDHDMPVAYYRSFADLSITKTDDTESEIPGTSVAYTITVTNNGPGDANGAAISDVFPTTLEGVTYTSLAAGGASGNNAAGSGDINDTLNMPAGSSVTYTVNATIASSATGILTNTATVTAPAGGTDPTPANNSATDTDTLSPSADVAVTKSDSPDPVVAGNNITYSITVSNNGPSDAQSLSLSDVVPTNTKLVSVTTPASWTRTDTVPPAGTGTITFTRPTLAAGASSTFTLIVKVNADTPDGTTITNTANVSSTTADPTPANGSASATTLVQNVADLAVSKTRAPLGNISAGTDVTYTIQVTNNGPDTASNVTLTDNVPTGTSLVSQSNPSGWNCNTIPAGGRGTITCTKATMANNETATLTVVAKVNCDVANGTTINNTATVSGVSPSDGNTANNTSTASFVVANPAPVVTASVTLNQLPQTNHDLINVGLSALASDGSCPTPTSFTVDVFGNENDETPTAKNEVFSPDAKDIAVGTLRLRAERVNSGNGRVYLIIVRTTDSAGGSGFATVTVVVPKNSSQGSVNAVNAEATAAKAFADSHNGTAPGGYFVIGDGATIGNKQ